MWTLHSHLRVSTACSSCIDDKCVTNSIENSTHDVDATEDACLLEVHIHTLMCICHVLHHVCNSIHLHCSYSKWSIDCLSLLLKVGSVKSCMRMCKTILFWQYSSFLFGFGNISTTIIETIHCHSSFGINATAQYRIGCGIQRCWARQRDISIGRGAFPASLFVLWQGVRLWRPSTPLSMYDRIASVFCAWKGAKKGGVSSIATK